MKISYFKRVISPEVPCYIAGYGTNDVAAVITDDLYMTGLVADDGERKVLLISFDLLGLDEWYIRKIREKCAALLGTDPEAVMLTCTHTHTGPETRAMRAAPDHLNQAYLDKLEEAVLWEVSHLKPYEECEVYYYSQKVDENRNRRYVTACNNATFTPHRHEVIPIAKEYADQELGELIFKKPGKYAPIYLIGNYAAHPLAGHCPGIGGAKISADFPGAFRDYVTKEVGIECMYVTGAAGDLVPKEDEVGGKAAEEAGERLAHAAVWGIVDSLRNSSRFRMQDAKVGYISKKVRIPFRKNKIGVRPSYYDGMDAVDMEIQVIAIGDVCFIGVPGELCCEVGQEMKWHSPFRRAYIAYNATGYLGYLGSVSIMLAGGYEGDKQTFTARTGLDLVNTAADAMFELHDALFPQEDGDRYPDCLKAPRVNIPKN